MDGVNEDWQHDHYFGKLGESATQYYLGGDYQMAGYGVELALV
jgi:hypothetical protein